MMEIRLGSEPVQLAEPWLIEGVQAPSFAASDPSDSLKGYDLRVGDRPILRSLKELYERTGRALPPELAVLRGDACLVTHAVGLISQQGAGNVELIGYTARLEGSGSTVEMLPNTSFKEYFTANFKFEAGVSADGFAKLPQQVTDLGTEVVQLGAGAQLQLGTQAGVVGKLSLSVKSPKIQAVGNASSTVTWQLAKDNQPLVGDQVLVQTLVVPRGQTRFTFEIQGFAVVSPGFFAGLFRRPVRIETKLRKVEVSL